MMNEVNQDVSESVVRPLHEIFKVAREFHSAYSNKSGQSYYMCAALTYAEHKGKVTYYEELFAKLWIRDTLKLFSEASNAASTLAGAIAEITGTHLYDQEFYVRGMTSLAWDAMIDKLEHDYNESH